MKASTASPDLVSRGGRHPSIQQLMGLPPGTRAHLSSAQCRDAAELKEVVRNLTQLTPPEDESVGADGTVALQHGSSRPASRGGAGPTALDQGGGHMSVLSGMGLGVCLCSWTAGDGLSSPSEVAPPPPRCHGPQAGLTTVNLGFIQPLPHSGACGPRAHTHTLSFFIACVHQHVLCTNTRSPSMQHDTFLKCNLG